jgi:predicted O-methyltransferase YrrM
MSDPHTWVPPGHFYSPIVDTAELRERKGLIFNRSRAPTGVDLNVAGQLATLDRFSQIHQTFTLEASPQPHRRFFLSNPSINLMDATVLSCMLMDVRPKRVIEIGSGYSSAAMLDIWDTKLDRMPHMTFIEPYTEALYSVLKPGDAQAITIHESAIQDISPSIVDDLEANDILFIDSTHVAKAGSDVLFEFFELFPRLKSGVVVHLHDIFYPFEYPEAWFYQENRSWNEQYLLRAFLTNNPSWEILIWNHYLHLNHNAALAKGVGAAPAQHWGGSFWMRKR